MQENNVLTKKKYNKRKTNNINNPTNTTGQGVSADKDPNN